MVPSALVTALAMAPVAPARRTLRVPSLGTSVSVVAVYAPRSGTTCPALMATTDTPVARAYRWRCVARDMR
jgi:hypothetical protein